MINIHAGFTDYREAGRRVQVICPDCGAKGANPYPCWCYECKGEGSDRVLMLPTINGIWIQSWSEYRKNPGLGRIL